jgi:Sec-independent protein translocase protein TatA
LGKGLREFQNATKGFSEQADQVKQEIVNAVHIPEPTEEKIEDAEVVAEHSKTPDSSKHS